MPSMIPSNSRRRNSSRPTRNAPFSALLDDRGDHGGADDVAAAPAEQHVDGERGAGVDDQRAERGEAGAPQERDEQQARRLGLPAVDPQERGHRPGRPGSSAHSAPTTTPPSAHARADQPEDDQPADAQRDQPDDGSEHAPALALLRGQRGGGAAGQEHTRGLGHGARAYASGRSGSSGVRQQCSSHSAPPTSTSAQPSPTAAAAVSARRGLDRSGLRGGEDQQPQPCPADDRARHRRRLRHQHRARGDQRLDGRRCRARGGSGPAAPARRSPRRRRARPA